ncbi:DUF4145 domain-containing protein [Marispirochaeta aestuarii]|uniref:DUF4145 domain-containing protein n=1 Tax=Marispirochaeta aestuarii TaxID=1963862 RepID=UPI0029C7BCF7|nr:DUF4145 domain-containing protein [Marispirochaeta aestuarii]
MQKNSNAPAIDKPAFNCPHCGAFTTQYWYNVYLDQFPRNSPTPFIPGIDAIKRIETNTELPAEIKEEQIAKIRKTINGELFIEDSLFESFKFFPLKNLFIAECYICSKVSIWIFDKIIYPRFTIDVQPNEDMPETVKKLFEEAKLIVNDSPKGSAALLRLAVEYLCEELGAKGKTLDNKIGYLVSKGLDKRVEQALDSLRVIGNESVHPPGEINLDDKRELSLELFELLNFICDDMITREKRIKKVYDMIPKEKLEGIENRNKKNRS